MTKSLTEQMLNGTLEDGDYWCEITESPFVERVHLPRCDDVVVEVLAPAPDYTEWKQTEEQVQNLQRMVEQECSRRCELEWRIEELEQQNAFECECNKEYTDTLKKNEQLESRLKEAEEALKDFCDDCSLLKCGGCDEDCAGWKAKQYLERYGKR